MNKQEFLDGLRKGLTGLPQDDIEERLAFYSEMIDDRTEEGLSEEEAVAEVGSVDEIIRQTVADTPLSRVVKERIKPKRRLRAWEIVLLILGSPIWLSMGLAVTATIFAIYAVLWSVIAALWAVFCAFAVCAVASVPGCIVIALRSGGAAGLAVLSAGIVCAGLSIFMFFGCREATKGVIVLTKKLTIMIKNCFIRKGEE